MKFFPMILKFGLLLGLLLHAGIILSQDDKLQEGTKKLDELLSSESYKEAETNLKLYIEDLTSKNLTDSLADYIYYVGRIEMNLTNKEQAIEKTISFCNLLEKKAENNRSKKQILIELATFYEVLNDHEMAYKTSEKALEIANSIPDKKGGELGLIENNMGVYSSRMGDIGQATFHIRNANNHYQSDPEADPSSFYLNTSSMGNMMWYASKFDSALIYYERALEILNTLEPSPLNSFYRPAILKNNMAGLHNINGEVSESIAVMESAIKNLQNFLASDVKDIKKKDATEFIFQLIDNLGGAYKDLGDYNKAKELIKYSYEQKIRSFDSDSPEIYKGKVLMGQIELALQNFNEAKAFLLEAIQQMDDSQNDALFWYADANYYLAVCYEECNENTEAEKHYGISEEYFEKAYQGSFDELYLDFVRHAAPFYAKIGQREKALDLANRANEYTLDVSSENLMTYMQTLNVGEVNFILGDYQKSLFYCTEALDILSEKIEPSANRLDSMQINFNKPLAIYLSEKSKMKLNNSPTLEDLKSSFNNMNEAVSILDHHKSLSLNENLLSILISDFESVFDFTEFLAYELYKKTGDEKYLDRVINLNESALYNRIRNRLNVNERTIYKDVPKSILEEEKKLQERLSSILTTDEESGINDFLSANKDWTTFINSLEISHPKYFKLKYASIEASTADIQEYIPDGSTVVRYFFIEDEAYALVMDNKHRNIVPIDYSKVQSSIKSLDELTQDYKTIGAAYHELYRLLWQPIEDKIIHENVVIVPDRELFNLSFEALSSESESDFNSCLLNKYSISYNYSLFLLDKNKKTMHYNSDFIAFAPGFGDEMKEEYKIAINDSIQVDRTYLTLLPQPHNIDLAKSFTNLFKGESFLNESSTEKVFINSAKEHKIIHIGTHAESNNISPELSRLIFAKDINDSLNMDDNSLYTYEIYNTNLSSNLAILTACETGKPTYQAGEGMISLAHAFNYAGSESILTSLWKIDEQSSAKIIEHFYNFLSQGMPKDDALRKAKLKYLKTAKGRTKDPSYWAGLVLIGDASPIELSLKKTWLEKNLIFVLLGVVSLIIIVFASRRKKSRA